MRRPLGILLLLLPLAARAEAPARARDLVPAQAEAVVVYPHPARMEAKWAALVGLFGGKDPLMDLKAQTGIDPARLGPGAVLRVGLPKTGEAEAWAWLLPAAQPRSLLQGLNPKGQGSWTWSVPAPKAKKDAKAAPGTLHGAAHRGFLVVASSAEALDLVRKAKDTLADELGSYAPWVETHDATLVMTQAGVARVAQEVAKASEKKAKDPGEGEGASPLPTPKAPSRVQKKLEAWMDMARTSVSHALISLDLPEAGGLRIVARAPLAPGSALARELASLAPVADHPMKGLPASGFALAVGGEWSSLFDLQAAVFEDLGQGKAKEATLARIQGALADQNRHIRSWSAALAAPAPGAPLFGGLTALLRVDDSRAYLSAIESMAQAQEAFFGELGTPGAVTLTNPALPGVPSVTVNSRPAGKEGDPAAAQLKQSLGMLLGGESIQVSSAALDEHRVLSVMGGPELLKARLGAAQGAASGLPGSVAGVDGDLGAGHRFSLYLDLKGLRDVGQLVAGMFMGPEAKALPPVPDVPAVGLALHLDPTALEVRGSARGETLRAAAAFFKAVKAQFPSQPKPGKGKAAP